MTGKKNSNRPHISIAMVGHVDHGKSTLIGRLLLDTGQIKQDVGRKRQDLDKNIAFLADHLEEERRELRTIDVFYTNFKTPKYEFTLIDDPGHKELIKNMLTGVSQADGAVLLVSAKGDEGIREQTKRHMRLVKLLGISRVLVAINKMDTVSYKQEVYYKLKKETEALLKEVGYDLKSIFFVPISATEGDNVYRFSDRMAWYQGKTLYQLLDFVFKPSDPPRGKPLRISIQGVYQFGNGSILAGQVQTGKFAKGDLVHLTLSGEKARVQKIVTVDKSKQKASSGNNIGIKLSKEAKIPQGEVITHPDFPAKIRRDVKAEIFLFSSKPLKVGEELKFHCGTAERRCLLKEIYERIDSGSGETVSKGGVLNESELGIVKLSFSTPVVVEPFSIFPQLGRFVLQKDGKLVAVGICLN